MSHILKMIPLQEVKCFSLEDMINVGFAVGLKCARTTIWDLFLLLCVLINQEFNVLHYET